LCEERYFELNWGRGKQVAGLGFDSGEVAVGT
jgi:hypothetical protein